MIVNVTRHHLSKFVPGSILLVSCDVTGPCQVKAAFETIVDQVGKIDGIVYSIAHAAP
ncbi:SDR family oxidoreductase [Ligilactobacillus pobuzihii]|nr:SDR family oxidoreductase [Ligilactobacillus pobuzihii]